LEVVKHSRAPSTGKDGRPETTTICLYGHHAPDIRGSSSGMKWASERAERHRAQRLQAVRRMEHDQSLKKGGLLVALRSRISRSYDRQGSSLLHCRVNKAALPHPSLFSDYAKAFQRWDLAMIKGVPGYAHNEDKRRWYVSKWHLPWAQRRS
jgi:hypothetical protein